MAKNLLKAGHQVVVSSHNRSTAVELVITMLPSSPDVRAVALGTDGIIAGAHPGWCSWI